LSRPGHFHHLVVEVSDLARSEGFYGETLGLDPVGRGVWPEPAPHAVFRTSESQYVVLVEVGQVKPDGPGVHTNFGLSFEDYPAVHARLEAAGALLSDHRDEQRTVGELSTYLQDPDGHRLQITSYSADAFRVPAAGRGKIVAGRIDDFPVGSVTHIKEGKFFLVRTEEGVLALNQVCTHMQCNVTYQPEHYRFYCACHYSRFTRKGAYLGHIAGTPPLHTYPIELVDGAVVVDTDVTCPRTPEEAEVMRPL